MKLKKVLAIAMATVMTAAMLVGCGSKGGSNEGTKSAEVQDVALKVWVPEEEVEITKKMCDDFAKAHPEYKCTFDVSIVGIDESVNLLTTDPDLAADVMNIRNLQPQKTQQEQKKESVDDMIPQYFNPEG